MLQSCEPWCSGRVFFHTQNIATVRRQPFLEVCVCGRECVPRLACRTGCHDKRQSRSDRDVLARSVENQHAERTPRGSCRRGRSLLPLLSGFARSPRDGATSARDDSAPFYRCVMRRRSRGNFWRITESFDRHFLILRPRSGLLRFRRRPAAAVLNVQSGFPSWFGSARSATTERAGFSRQLLLRRRGSDGSKVLSERDKAGTATGVLRRRSPLLPAHRRCDRGERERILCMETARVLRCGRRTLHAVTPASAELGPCAACHGSMSSRWRRLRA